jgi:hypothetical protein
MRRRLDLDGFKAAGLVALSAMALVLVMPSASRASGLCSGLTGNFFDGAQTSSTQYYGVQAQIQLRTPALCTPSSVPNEFSAAWVMLTPANSDGWAQSGYGNFRAVNGGPSGMLNFTQWCQAYGAPADCSNPPTQYFNTPSGTNFYYVAYNWVNHVLDMLDAPQGDVGASTNFDPYAGTWATPVRAQTYTETAECTNDVIGTQSSAAAFSQIEGETSQGVWPAPADLALQTPGCSRYHNKWGTQTSLLYTWTF